MRARRFEAVSPPGIFDVSRAQFDGRHMSSKDPPPVASARALPALAPLRRRLISAGFWSLVGRFAAIGLFFVTDMMLARALSKIDFGAFYLVTQATVFLGTLTSLGTPQILSRTIRQTLHSSHPERVAEVIRKCSQLLIFGCLATSAGFFVVAPWLASRGDQWAPFRDDWMGILAWACLGSACLNSAFTLQALDDFRTATFVGSRRGGILPNLFFLGFTVIAWHYGFINLRTAIFAQAAFQAVTLLVGRRAIQSRLKSLLPDAAARPPSPVANSREPSESRLWYLGEGLPFLAMLLLWMAIDELDGLWVGLLVDDTLTADYGAAKRLVRLMMVPFVMFGTSLSPFIAELLAKNERERLQRIMRGAATLVSLPMAAVMLAYIVVPRPILEIAYGPHFREAAPLLRLLTVGPCVAVIAGHSSSVLLMAGRQKTLMYCTLVGLAAYTALLVPAVRMFGAAGAAAVQSAVLIGVAVACTLLAHRQVGIWTVASLRPREVIGALKSLVGKRGRPVPSAAAGDSL